MNWKRLIDSNGNAVIPNGVTRIDERAFSGCTNLKNIKISKSVTEIGWEAFLGCTGLKSVVIPDNVWKIEDSAFNGCSNLERIVLPTDVEIDSFAFAFCDSLISIVDSSMFRDDNRNCLLSNDQCTLILGCKTTRIPYGVTTIGEYAFSGCTGLVGVEIPPTVTEIGEGAFSGCSSLASIVIPNTVTEVGFNAFDECYGLEKVYISDPDLLNDTRINTDMIVDTGFTVFSESDFTVSGSYDGHDYADLGVLGCWATCNVGAECLEDKGTIFNAKNFDNVKYLWGVPWSIPWSGEREYEYSIEIYMQELRRSCIWIPGLLGNTSGYKVIAPNGNCIFINEETPLVSWGEDDVYVTNAQCNGEQPLVIPSEAFLRLGFHQDKRFLINDVTVLKDPLSESWDVLYAWCAISDCGYEIDLDDMKKFEEETGLLSCYHSFSERLDLAELVEITGIVDKLVKETGLGYGESCNALRCAFNEISDVKTWVDNKGLDSLCELTGEIYYRTKRDLRFLCECIQSSQAKRVEYAAKIISGMHPTSTREKLLEIYCEAVGEPFTARYELVYDQKQKLIDEVTKIILEQSLRPEGSSREELELWFQQHGYGTSYECRNDSDSGEYVQECTNPVFSLKELLRRLSKRGIIRYGEDSKWHAVRVD